MDSIPEVRDDENVLVLQVAELLVAKHLTIATAESCTGGLLSGALTGVSGASAFYLGGVVAYDNRVKADVLGVPQSLIDSDGAVSAAVAIEMARRGRALIGADICIAITGIAGPLGATPGKPVGTTFIAFVSERDNHAQEFHFSGDRAGNRASSVREALRMLIEHLQSEDTPGATPVYEAEVAAQ